MNDSEHEQLMKPEAREAYSSSLSSSLSSESAKSMTILLLPFPLCVVLGFFDFALLSALILGLGADFALVNLDLDDAGLAEREVVRVVLVRFGAGSSSLDASSAELDSVLSSPESLSLPSSDASKSSSSESCKSQKSA